MIDLETARQIALSLPGTTEQPHFDKPSFRVSKRIFSTLWVKERRVMALLSPVDQSVFNLFDATIFYPVPNNGIKGGYIY